MEVTGDSSVKRFFEDFNKERISPTGEDTVQLRAGIVGNYALQPDDVQCEIFDWVIHYLEQRKCPLDLSMVLAQKVALHLSASLQQLVSHPEDNSNKDEIKNYLDPHHLYLRSLSSLQELCDHWRNCPEIFNLRPCSPHFVSVGAIKNGRRKMEDRHIVFPDLNFVCGLQGVQQYSYYAVFDGHAGVDTASFAAAHLHHNIVEHPSFLTDPELSIKEAFLATDEQFLERETTQKASVKSGCTALCALIQERALYLSWLGDSQAVLVKQGVPYSIMAPHKPERKDEKKRIENLGGMVLYHGTWRVNGTLAVSRALGDAEHKPFVTSEPDVVTIPLDGNEDFLILACDGLWDRLALSDVGVTTYQYLDLYPDDAENVASRLIHKAKDQGSSDNITAIVIFLKDMNSLIASAKEYSGLLPQLHNLFSSQDHFVNGDAQNYFGCDSNTDHVINPSDLDLSLDFKQNYSAKFSNEEVSFNVQQNDFVEPMAEMHSMAFAPETTAFSELPTPPIDEIVANQKLGNTEPFDAECSAQDKRTMMDALNIIDHDEAVEIASEIVTCAIEIAVKQVANDTLECAYEEKSLLDSPSETLTNPFASHVPSGTFTQTGQNLENIMEPLEESSVSKDDSAIEHSFVLKEQQEPNAQPSNLTLVNLTNDCLDDQLTENVCFNQSELLLESVEVHLDITQQEQKVGTKGAISSMHEVPVKDSISDSSAEVFSSLLLPETPVEHSQNEFHKESPHENTQLLDFPIESLEEINGESSTPGNLVEDKGSEQSSLISLETAKDYTSDLTVKMEQLIADLSPEEDSKPPNTDLIPPPVEQVFSSSKDVVMETHILDKNPEIDLLSLNADEVDRVQKDPVMSPSTVTTVNECNILSLERELNCELNSINFPPNLTSSPLEQPFLPLPLFPEQIVSDHLANNLPVSLQETSQINFVPEIQHLKAVSAQSSVVEDSAVLEVIPDSVPEAEGVTEDMDSDSEKDGGWSYIKGEITQEAASGVNTAVIDVSKITLKMHDKQVKTSPPKPPRKDIPKSTAETGARSKPSALQQVDKKSTIKERKDRPLVKVSPMALDKTKANLPGFSKKSSALPSRVQTTKTATVPTKAPATSRPNLTQPSSSAKAASKESTLPNKQKLPAASSSVKPTTQRSVPALNRQRQVPARPVSATALSRPKTDISSRPLSSTLKSNNEMKSKQNNLSSQATNPRATSLKQTNSPAASTARVDLKPKSRVLPAQSSVAAGTSKSLPTQLDTKQTKENANKQILKRNPVQRELPKRPVGTIAKRPEPKQLTGGSKSVPKVSTTQNTTSKPLKAQSKPTSKTASAQNKEANNQSISESPSKQIKDSELEEKGSLEMDKRETADPVAEDPSSTDTKEPQ